MIGCVRSPVEPHPLAPVVHGRQRVLCCHRSVLSGAHAPNSLAAIQECVEQRVPRIEIDLWLLVDGTMLVFHDQVLDHETSGAGVVEHLALDEVRDVRYRTGEPLAFLDEVVEVVRAGRTLLQVDLKPLRLMNGLEVAAIGRALAPIADRVLVGSQAHWNLRPLAGMGIAVALDPTLHWHAAGWLAETGSNPQRMGPHGFWDDSPLASQPGVPAAGYIASRIADLLGLVPAVEWMVDYRTLLWLQELGCNLGDALAAHGVELAAWTLKDRGPAETAALARALFGLGATTLITDAPLALAAYLAG